MAISASYSSRTLTSSLRVSPVRNIYNTATKPKKLNPYSSTYQRNSPDNNVKSKLTVIENTSNSYAFDAKFVLFLVSLIIGTFITILMLNIFVSSISIKAVAVANEIQKVKEDTQTIKSQIEQRGDAIAAKVGALGMVSRDKWINIRLENRKTTESNSAISGNNSQ